ncbi:hypothetical protein GCM10010988_13850 [Cnuibacter physcomitrellae]|uniref:Uncharacterized protein n=2 Tax=Cnuibacter physcomitrellae TaxID=1619308 RepID=A0A1X9LPG2_9MICO|nr:hypothetical protein B5808_13880 [Cnuibacter physcomitrellae]GGI37418.1 hypothetical protein GCM10010988_13850 [Cnuibacter physcomitrellae]
MDGAMRSPRRSSVEVDGGSLAVHEWPGNGPDAVVAVHGITANHAAFHALAEALPDVRLIAPDLRGRGSSRALPGPYTLDQHAEDVLAVITAASAAPVTLVGHSMGAFVAVLAAARRPDLVRSLVLVDGGLPFPPGPGSEEERVQATLGPALARLDMTFSDREAYHDFWRTHPAFAGSWSDAIAAYADADLVGEGPDLRPGSNPEAIAVSARELLGHAGHASALRSLAEQPVTFIRAPRGLLDQPEALYSPDVVDAWRRELPGWRIVEADDANHYTVVMAPAGAALVARVVRDAPIPTAS